jgi:AhpD family alkylhydroperoxidase
MARISGVDAKKAGPVVRLAYVFTRRRLAHLARREPERIIEPLQMYAHTPGLLRAYGRLELATGKLRRVDKRLMLLADLKAATLTHCEYCIDLGSQIARQSGLSDAGLLALATYQTSPYSPPPTSWCSTTRSA